MGWPRESSATAAPNAGEAARKRTPTCKLDDVVGVVRDQVLDAGRDLCIVVNDAGIVEGRLRGDALLKSELEAEEAMEVGPTTIRPSESLEPLVARMRKRGVKTIVVTDAKGHLVGILYRNDAAKILADLNIDPG
jgi:Mg/Co/Ni transporter MgtE